MAARLRISAATFGVVTALLVGCSMIVPDDVPEFRCTGSDPTSCPSGLVCSSGGVCVSPMSILDGGEDVTIDEDGSVEEAGDAPPGPSPLGGDCIVDGDCAAGLLCGTSTLLTSAIVPANSKSICTQPCCRSADCAAGFICFPGGTGGNYCVAAAKANRTPPETGGKAGGASCAGHDSCRSGLCTAARCVDTCCDPDQCGTGSTCRIATVNQHVGWACSAPNASGADLNAPCSANADCKNDNCVQPFSAGKRCTPPCCRSSDCTSLGFANNVCAYGQAGTDNLKWCYERNLSGKGTGQTCASNNDCASRYCDAELGKCANVCCTTADCNSGETCRPSPGGTPFLRCVRDR